MRVALTLVEKSRPMLDPESFESHELSECVRRIPVKKIGGGVRKRSGTEQKTQGSNRMFRPRFGGPGETILREAWNPVPIAV